MAALSFVAMYVLMYAMVDRVANVHPNLNQLYMAALMTAPMIVLELVLMGGVPALDDSPPCRRHLDVRTGAAHRYGSDIVVSRYHREPASRDRLDEGEVVSPRELTPQFEGT